MKTRYTILPILFLLGLISCNFVASNKSEGNGARVLALNYDPSTVNSGDAYKQTKLSVQGKLSYPDGTPIEYANLNIKSAGLTTSLSVRSTSGYLSFGDVDVDRGEIEGVLFLKKVSDETDIKSYTLYWANADNISLSKIATFYKTGTDPSYVFKENTPIYTGAKKFTFFSVDKSGNETLLEALEFKDSGPSFSTDENGNYTIILGLGKSKIGVSKDGKDLGDISISIESVDAKPIPEVTSSEFSAVVTGVTQLSPEDVKALESVTKPTVPPSTISFTDTDPDALQLGGEILIGKASAESNITHYGLYFAQSATVKARLLAFIAKTGSDIKVTISGNLPIPEGSQYLMVVSKNTAGEMSTGPSVLINDYVKPPTAPSLTAASISFTDTDNTQNAIAGQVSITKASDESNIDSYVLYWGNSATTRLSTTPIAELNKTGANLVYNVATNTAIPAGATHFLVFTKNAVGEMVTGISVAIVDTLPNAKEITSFSIPSIPQATAIITGTNIALNIPFGNAITNLVAGFTTTGASVKIGTTVQVSGTTANDFTNPLTYTVTAVDGSTQNYTVTTTVAANQAPVASSVTFSGSITLASSLTGTFSYSDPDGHTAGTHTYQWYRCTDNTSAPPTNCSAISGATGITYTLTIADDLKYIRFAVTPVDQYALAGTMVYSAASNIADLTAPTLSKNVLNITGLSATSATLSWTAASDTVTTQASLQYLLYYSSNSTMTTVAEIEANGTPVGSYTSNLLTQTASGLTSNTAYYFNVIVKDEAGNKTAYKTHRDFPFSGMVAYYPFNNNATDIISGLNGTIYGSVSPTSDIEGNPNTAYSFDGSTGYILTSSNVGIAGTSARTLSVRIKSSTTSFGDYSHIIDWGSFGFFINNTGNSIGFWGGGTNNLTAQTITTSWENWLVSYDGTNFNVYKNGIKVLGPTSQVINTTDSPLRIGYRSDGTLFFPGIIDDIRIYNRALTDAEALVIAGKYTFSGPLTNFDISLLHGWSICYQETYAATTTTVSSVLSSCNKANLMMACRLVASPNSIILAAYAPRADVTFATGANTTSFHNANGVDWYFDSSGGGSDSWGFAGAGTGVSKSNCDTGSVSPELRLCWHTPTSGVVNSGYRCGSTTSTGATYERLIFHAD